MFSSWNKKRFWGSLCHFKQYKVGVDTEVEGSSVKDENKSENAKKFSEDETKARFSYLNVETRKKKDKKGQPEVGQISY